MYSYVYSYGQIALVVACAITDHTRTSKTTDYCPIVWLVIFVIFMVDWQSRKFPPTKINAYSYTRIQ
jgi:hypothetical protein